MISYKDFTRFAVETDLWQEAYLVYNHNYPDDGRYDGRIDCWTVCRLFRQKARFIFGCFYFHDF